MKRGAHSEKSSGINKNIALVIALVVAVVLIIAMVFLAAQCSRQKAYDQISAGAGSTSVWNTSAKSNSASSSASVGVSTSQSASSSSNAATIPAQKTEKMQNAENAVQQIVSQYGDNVAVVVRPLDGTSGFSINGDKKFISASMIKLLILAEFMGEVDSKRIKLDDVRVVDSGEIVGGTGVIQNGSGGAALSYDELARDMIMYSDNTATNILIDKMGMDTINSKAHSLQLNNTDLQRKMMDLNSGLENHISANDASNILFNIANGTLASREMCEKAKSYLVSQTDSQGLAEGIPSGVEFGHKTGSLESVRHDGGIVYAGYPYVIVVLTSLDASTANSVMADVSRTVFDALN